MANYASTNTGDEIQAKLDYVNIDSSDQLYKSIFIMNDDLSYGSSGPMSQMSGYNLVWAYTINDDSLITEVLPADVDVASDIEVYIYWGINEAYATNSGEIRFTITGYLTAVGEVITAGVDSFSFDTGDIDIPATANTIVKTNIDDIPAADIDAVRDIIGAQIKRVALNDGNNPSGAEPYIIAIELRYKSKLAGETIT